MYYLVLAARCAVLQFMNGCSSGGEQPAANYCPHTPTHSTAVDSIDDKIFTVVFSYQNFHHFYFGLLQRLHFQSQGICKSGTETVG